jgi:hypothetical protein
MLQRVRRGDRDYDERDWSPRVDNPYGRRYQPADDTDHFARRKRRKRSATGRVTKTAFLAVLLMALGAGAYYFAGTGAIQSFLARAPSSASPVTAADAATPQPPETPQKPETASLLAPEATMAQPLTAAPPAAPGLPPEQSALPIPPVEGLVMLIRNAVVALGQANEAGNYSVLRDLAAPDFRKANTPADLTRIFAELRSRKLNLAQVTVVNPRLHAEPALDDDGMLRLTGAFTAEATDVDFEMLFQPLEGRWQLFGIGLAPAPSPPAGDQAAPAAPAAGKVPDAATLVALIRGAVIALNQANLTGNYSVLRDLGAPGFREGNDLVKLTEIFAALRARALDLSPVAVIDPQLFRPAAIDEDGYLRLTGFFASRPEQVNFDLAFQFVDGAWRHFGIGLNTSRDAPAGEAVAAPAGSNAAPAPAADNGPAPAAPRIAGAPPTPRLRPAQPPPG